LGNAISISLASCEFLLFSILSTLFHNIPLSENSCGAFCGNRISVWAIPPFLVKSWTILFIFSPLRQAEAATALLPFPLEIIFMQRWYIALAKNLLSFSYIDMVAIDKTS